MVDSKENSQVRENKTNVKHVEIEYAASDTKQNSKMQLLQQEFENFKTLSLAKDLGLFDNVKPKFKESVYNMLDYSKSIKEQLTEIKQNYQEFFISEKKVENEKINNVSTSPNTLEVEKLLKTWNYK